ncbi:inorganic phosphate transporter [Mastigocoleus testarum]|uniref:Phosphate transporter n=1 Tax=Mastigocoleus testarum BC008 TaxID=371196 RepID=A0A0V7ZUI9_9CYAN|nr:inorganic phosphate transporter [Mastigocoleus testarum]KST67862.1 phosphate permease [Mastigocoleus testarum BC008]
MLDSLPVVILLGFYIAWNLGANDVANSMGTSVGSKAVTLKQALIIAGILEFSGAVLFGHQVSKRLAGEIINPELFAYQPQILVTGMIAVLLACGLWLQIATFKGLPVSSSHAVVGAIAGFSWVAVGATAIDWLSIEEITFGWVLTPVISGFFSTFLYKQIRFWILDKPEPLSYLREWIPWLSLILFGIFGAIVLPTLTPKISNFLLEQIGINILKRDLSLFAGVTGALGLTIYSWRQLDVITKKQNTSYSQSPIENIFSRFQLVSACFVAFAHGSNDVGNAIAPLAAIVYIKNTGNVPGDDLNIPIWVLIVGGVGIITGLGVWGKKVIATIGENIITLEPSSGFCAELATATTVLLASTLGLPVSTSHALVGAVVGIGLMQNSDSLQLGTIRGIAAAWFITIPVSALLSATIFSVLLLVG